MAISIGSFRPINTGYSRVNSQAYSLENQASVSDAFNESSINTSVGGAFTPVDAAPPVSYPTAQRNGSLKDADAMEEVLATSKAYNNIAANFEGRSTGYSATRFGSTYATAGSTIDFYA